MNGVPAWPSPKLDSAVSTTSHYIAADFPAALFQVLSDNRSTEQIAIKAQSISFLIRVQQTALSPIIDK